MVTRSPTIAAPSISQRSTPVDIRGGAWTIIFRKNLANTSRALISSELAAGKLPASLGAVTVMFVDQPTFVEYVSPTQINVQAPGNVGSGVIAITLTNAGERPLR